MKNPIILGEAKDKLSMLNKKSKSGTMRSVSVTCQFLLTLTILRRNYGYTEAGLLFKINNPDIVQCVFKTWLLFMFKELGSKEWRKKLFVKLEDLPRPFPEPFDNDILNKVRIVIDTTLIEVKKYSHCALSTLNSCRQPDFIDYIDQVAPSIIA